MKMTFAHDHALQGKVRELVKQAYEGAREQVKGKVARQTRT